MALLENGIHRLYYDVIDLTAPWAEAPETILFHHGVGACAQCWRGWLPALLDRYRLAMFDLPGHGRSQPGDGAITIADMVDDVIALADALECERFHLVGESIGGTVALQTAIDHQPRLLSLTVSNGAHMGGSIEHVDFWREVIEGEGMSAWSDRMMQGRFFGDALEDEADAWYRAQQASADPATVLALLETLVGADLSDGLPALTLPVLLLHADSSPFILVPVMADLRDRLPQAQLHVFPHSRHGLPFSHAAPCSATLRAFLDESAA